MQNTKITYSFPAASPTLPAPKKSKNSYNNSNYSNDQRNNITCT